MFEMYLDFLVVKHQWNNTFSWQFVTILHYVKLEANSNVRWNFMHKNKTKKTYAFIHSHCTNSKLPPCKFCMRLGLWNIIIVIMINDSECEGNWLYRVSQKCSKNIKNVKNGNFFLTFRRKLILLFRKKVIGQTWHQIHFYSICL